MTSHSSGNPHVSQDQVRQFKEHGFVVIKSLIDVSQLEQYRDLYDQFLSGKIDCTHIRRDLGGHEPQKKQGIENITHIVRPCDLIPDLIDGVLHQRALEVARQLLGHDIVFDFDMLIDKAPMTDTPTPWHQDAAYWIDMPDTRAVSGWVALDKATLENGCIWFVPGSHGKDLRSHQRAGGGGGGLACQGNEAEGVAVPLKPGDATFHHGRTLHYSRGNSTHSHRRAYTVNFRPQAMVQHERDQGFDHGLAKK